ncbi:hypothetical protein D3C75_978010 [compost metagenome]
MGDDMAHNLSPAIGHFRAVLAHVLKNIPFQPLIPRQDKLFHLRPETRIKRSNLIQRIKMGKILLKIRFALYYHDPAPLYIGDMKQRLQDPANPSGARLQQLLFTQLLAPFIPIFPDHPVIVKKRLHEIPPMLKFNRMFVSSLSQSGTQSRNTVTGSLSQISPLSRKPKLS